MAERKSFLLRLPQELWDDLQRLASADLRSVNAEIEFLLKESVKKRLKVSEEDSLGSSD